MLPIDPPLAALHGQRLDHSGAVAHSLLNATEHLTARVLQMQGRLLESFIARSSDRQHAVPAMAAVVAANDPVLHDMGVQLVKEQIHLAADVGAQWVAFGEWHQHGINALWSHWLAHVSAKTPLPPFRAGISAMQRVLETADGAVSDAATAVVETSEQVVEQADNAVARPPRRKANANN